MDDNIDKYKDKGKIIEKCINASYETRRKLTISMFNWKNTFYNLKDSVKYNLVNFNIKFIPQESSEIHFFNKKYNPMTEKGYKNYNSQLKKILLVTYRSNYKEQTNIKNGIVYTSDCGWGCMIRSSQMIVARMIYKIFKYLYKNKFTSYTIIKSIIPFFMDNNITMTSLNIKSSDCIIIGMDNYLQQLNKLLEKKISDNGYKKLIIRAFDPPFSIHKICILGEIFGRTCGEWFSDFELPKIYEIINTTFNIIPNLSILHFNSDIDMNLVIEKCFKKIENIEEIPDFKPNNYFTNEKNEKYDFKKMGAIFVSVRLGVDTIQNDYFDSIKKLFECKQFLGFMGGKINSASYFFGYSGEDLLFLDPHYNQESINDLDEQNLMTYIDKIVYKLPFKSLQCAFTIGFLFRDLKEFRELYIFFKLFMMEKLPCFHVQMKQNKKTNDISPEEIEQNINNELDDF